MNTKQSIVVLGAGVSGLSTGILLLRKGYPVAIWAKDFPPNTTSNKAAAIWFPFLCFPLDKATRWGKQTWDFFMNEIIHDPKSGCMRERVLEVFDKKEEDPVWKDGVDSFKRPSQADLPEGYKDGYEINGLIMDTNKYMDYLVAWFTRLGGQMIKKEVHDVQEAFAEYPLVINCTGLGSRKLFNDKKVFPVRGQTVRVKLNGCKEVYLDEDGHNGLAYIVPRLYDVVLGGTAQKDDWNEEVDEKDTKDILRKCAAIRPEFKQGEIIGESVGLRPARDEVRLEKEEFPNKKCVIHNYGHGGSGFTISWGCAQEIVGLVDKVFNSS